MIFLTVLSRLIFVLNREDLLTFDPPQIEVSRHAFFLGGGEVSFFLFLFPDLFH